MSIDRRHIGLALPVFTVEVTAERLTAFARAIGETAPRFAAEIAPPTFLKVIEGENNSSRAILVALGVQLKHVLHAEQEFHYVSPVRIGDLIGVERRVVDIYDKRNGAMEFIVIESVMTVMNGAVQTVAGRSRQIVLVRNPAKPLASDAASAPAARAAA